MENLNQVTFDFQNYPFVIKEKGGVFYFLCKKYNIIESDISLDRAYAKLNAARIELLNKLEDFGAAVNIDDVNRLKSRRKIDTVIKYSLIVLVLSIPLGLLVSMGVVAYKVGHVIATIKDEARSKVRAVLLDPNKISMTINHMANTLDNVTYERKKELQKSVRKIVNFMQPIVSELQPLSEGKK